MFRDYISFEDALSCYNHLVGQKAYDPDALRVLKANFASYARIKAEKSDPLAKGWIAARESQVLSAALTGPGANLTAVEPLASGSVEKSVATFWLDPSETDPMAEINAMIGLSGVKTHLSRLQKSVSVFQRRKESGLATPSLSYHMAFLGNPGTGKTSVARAVSRMLYRAGITTGPHVIEVDRSDLIGTKIGHTEDLTADAFFRARGGVLFIDEAHSLIQNYSQLDYGHEACHVIAKKMEDHRDDTVVIFAGYAQEMKQTILAHKAFKSRIGTVIRFENQTALECVEIFKSFCKDADYTPDADCLHRLERYFADEILRRPESFGNGRDVRTVFEKTVVRQSQRLSGTRKPTKKALRTLYATDLDFTKGAV